MNAPDQARESSLNRLLLVDDDESFCQTLARALERRGFAVSVACDVASGVETMRQAQPEFAIVDLRIGAESGLALVAKIAALDPHARVVVLTGYASIATAVEAIKLGAVHYVTKPAEPDEIIQALTRDQGDIGVPPPSAPMSVRRLEWEHLHKVLQTHDGNISAAARALSMHRRTLQRKLQKRPVQS